MYLSKNRINRLYVYIYIYIASEVQVAYSDTIKGQIFVAHTSVPRTPIKICRACETSGPALLLRIRKWPGVFSKKAGKDLKIILPTLLKSIWPWRISNFNYLYCMFCENLHWKPLLAPPNLGLHPCWMGNQGSIETVYKCSVCKCCICEYTFIFVHNYILMFYTYMQLQLSYLYLYTQRVQNCSWEGFQRAPNRHTKLAGLGGVGIRLKTLRAKSTSQGSLPTTPEWWPSHPIPLLVAFHDSDVWHSQRSHVVWQCPTPHHGAVLHP